jgi:Ca-activated chloride channel family protein
MRFLWPQLLLLLLLIPMLVALYLHVLARKKKAAVRFSSLLLVKEAMGPGQTWRRHLPPALFLAAMTVAILAAARPSATVTLPSEHMTLILAMDVSRSMLASDVTPNRISAAQLAAKSFVSELPPNVRVGIVSFAGTAAVVQTVTDRREDLEAAIDRFELQRGTATGSGLLVALGHLLPDSGIDLDAIAADNPYARIDEEGFSRNRGASIDRTRKSAKATKQDLTPVAPGSYSGGAIVLLSDGRRTTGPDALQAARMAADRGVRVFTVGFGSKDGKASGLPGGLSFFSVLDENTLKGVASITGGEYYHAGTSEDLKKIYASLSTKFSLEATETEISALFGMAAALLVIAAAVLSLLWFRQRV